MTGEGDGRGLKERVEDKSSDGSDSNLFQTWLCSLVKRLNKRNAKSL